MKRHSETRSDTAGATHRAESDTTGRNKGLATIVSGDRRLADINLRRCGTALLALPPASLGVVTGQAVGGVLRAARRVGRAAVDGRRTRSARVVAASG